MPVHETIMVAKGMSYFGHTYNFVQVWRQGMTLCKERVSSLKENWGANIRRGIDTEEEKAPNILNN